MCEHEIFMLLFSVHITTKSVLICVTAHQLPVLLRDPEPEVVPFGSLLAPDSQAP